MEEKIIDNKGITLIALIITIVLMLILVSVVTYTGIDAYKNTTVNHFVTQMQLLQAKVDDLVNTMSAEELEKLGLATATAGEQQNAINSAYTNGEVTTNEISSYKVFTPEKIIELFEVEDAQNAIMVNLNTREIVDLYGIEYEGKTYYTQYKLPNGQMIVNSSDNTQRDLTFDVEMTVNGINANVKAKNIKITNGTLSYKKKDDTDTNWKRITNYTQTDKENEVLISESGTYIFKLQDNTSNESKEVEITIKLANKPQTDITIDAYNYAESSEKWAYVQKDDSTYVWIPRFVYKTNSDTNNKEIKFIKGNSNIATDNTYVDEGWTVHNSFKKEDGTELTGIWIKVDSKNQKDLDMIQLLNDSTKETLTEINTVNK